MDWHIWEYHDSRTKYWEIFEWKSLLLMVFTNSFQTFWKHNVLNELHSKLLGHFSTQGNNSNNVLNSNITQIRLRSPATKLVVDRQQNCYVTIVQDSIVPRSLSNLCTVYSEVIGLQISRRLLWNTPRTLINGLRTLHKICRPSHSITIDLYNL